MSKTDAGHDLCTVEMEIGNTPLHSSCEKGDLEIVKVGYISRYVEIKTPYTTCTYIHFINTFMCELYLRIKCHHKLKCFLKVIFFS